MRLAQRQAYDDAREQDLADALELVANNLWLYTVNIEYPNGILELKGCKSCVNIYQQSD